MGSEATLLLAQVVCAAIDVLSAGAWWSLAIAIASLRVMTSTAAQWE
jgi:hypothetical protein